MTYKSKIRLFFLITSLLILAACNKKNDIIPDVSVDFTLNLLDPQFTQLAALGGSVTVNGRTNNWGHYADGYAGNGIIISRGVDEFFAYDRTCPYEYATSQSSVKIDIDLSGFARAKCPQCGTVYELISYGTPASGPGKHPLKNYKTSSDGEHVRVWNNY